MASYRYFRLRLNKNAVADYSYYTINEFSMYASTDATGANLLSGAKATSDGYYNSQLPSYANDGNNTTYWESSLHTPGSPAYLTFTLASPVTPRSFRLRSTNYPNERPIDFDIQVSTDGTTWVTLMAVIDWPNVDESVGTVGVRVQGVAKLATGEKASRLLIYKYATGAFVASITPGTDGSWVYYPWTLEDLLVVAIGASGYKPEADGPITPFEGA